MKPLRLALLIVALICFVLYVSFDWRTPAPSPGSRPNFLGLGLTFWMLAELSSAL
jgi:hypothetical protein